MAYTVTVISHSFSDSKYISSRQTAHAAIITSPHKPQRTVNALYRVYILKTQTDPVSMICRFHFQRFYFSGLFYTVAIYLSNYNICQYF
jgi:hypothetical protein